jgi:hypothetical protein
MRWEQDTRRAEGARDLAFARAWRGAAMLGLVMMLVGSGGGTSPEHGAAAVVNGAMQGDTDT